MSQNTLDQLSEWYAVVINAICAVICLIFTIAILYCFISNKTGSNSNIRLSTKYLASFCMILFTISSTIQIFTAYSSRINSVLYDLCAISGNGFWWIAQACCYITYINRLYYTFHGTSYQITNKILLSIYTLIILFILCHFGVFTIFILEYKTQPILNYHSAGKYYALFYILIEFIDITLCIFVIYLFASKLIALIAEFNEVDQIQKYQESIRRESIVTKSRLSMSLNHTQNIMVKIMTQWTLLITVSIIATQLFLIMRSITEVFYAIEIDGVYGGLVDNNMNNAALILMSFQSVVSVVTIFLMFEFGNKVYIICCGKLDKYCSLWFKKCARNKVTEVYEISMQKHGKNSCNYVKMEDQKL